jgi:hypothetical protein
MYCDATSMTWIVVGQVVNSLILDQDFHIGKGGLSMNVARSLLREHHDPFITKIHVKRFIRNLPCFITREITSSNTIPILMPTSFCMFISIIHFLPWITETRRSEPFVRSGNLLSNFNDGSMWKSKCIWMYYHIYIYISGFGVWMFGRHWIIQYTQPRSSTAFNPDASPRSRFQDGVEPYQASTFWGRDEIDLVTDSDFHLLPTPSPKKSLMTPSQKDRSSLKRQNVLFGNEAKHDGVS